MKTWLMSKLADWLNHERQDPHQPPSDYDRLCYEIRPGDVLLVEGRARVSEAIKYVTLSSWTHSALYIGRLHDIHDPVLRDHISQTHGPEPDTQLVLEALLGEGTVVRPLSVYRRDHLRICRPNRLSPQDAQRVISYAVRQLGREYDIRNLIDLWRFMVPWSVMPRRWRSTLFEVRAGEPTHTICSSLIARAFASVRYPVLPVLRHTDDGGVRLYRRPSRLFTPRDFDYSPYFDLIKYPVFEFDELALYRKLPWGEDGVLFRDAEMCLAKAIGDEQTEASPGDEKQIEEERAGFGSQQSCAIPRGLPTEISESGRPDGQPA